MAVPLLGQNKQEPEVQEREAEFAVLLIKGTDGSISLSTDIASPIAVARVPLPDEAMQALNSAYNNILAQQIAAVVLNGMVNMSQMAMSAQQNQDLLDALKNRPRG